MTDKICISVNIPTVNKKHDFIVPSTMSIEKIIHLITLTVSDEYGISKSHGNAMLTDTFDNNVLKNDCTMEQMGITSGAELILM